MTLRANSPRHGRCRLSGALIKIALCALGSVSLLASYSVLASELPQRVRLEALISQHAKAFGVPEALVHRVIGAESNYKADASSGGNYGLMQIRHATAQGMGYTGAPIGLLDPETNLTYGVPYLANAYHVAGGDHDRTIALYKGGYYYEAKRKRLLGTLVKAKPSSMMVAVFPHSTMIARPEIAAISAPLSPAPIIVVQKGFGEVLPAVAPMLTRAFPEPPRRPADLAVPPADGKGAIPAAEVKPVETPVDATEFADCIMRLQRVGLIAEIAITPNATNAACIIENPVRLTSLKVSGEQYPVGFPDQPVLACRFAERFGRWLGEIAVPLIAARLTPLRAVHTGPGYDCRNRNRARSGKLSAHAVGHAVDIDAFKLGGGETLSITEANDERKKGVLSTIRTAACGWFTTILGPGSDPAHATHWHFDIQKHGSSDNYRICG
jgi:hypothetical protein